MVAKGWGKEGMGSNELIGTPVRFGRLKRVLKMNDGGDAMQH